MKKYVLGSFVVLTSMLIFLASRNLHFNGLHDAEKKSQNDEYESPEQMPDWLDARYYYPQTADEVARERYDYLVRYGSFKNLAATSSKSLKKSQQSMWSNIGPYGIYECDWPNNRDDDDFSGRIISLAQDYGNGDIMYLGAASGGLWKSTDRGATWINILDDLAHPSVSTIAVNHQKSGEVWIGTGNKGDGVGGIAASSIGFVYHSPDYGDTWEPVTLTTDFIAWVSKIIIRPSIRADVPDVIFVATDIGVFRSEDGVIWQKVLPASGNKAFSDIVHTRAFTSADFEVVAAENWGSKLWYSKNKGLSGTWSSRTLPGASAELGRITLAASPLGSHDKVYANVAARSDNLEGVWRSDDRGNTWMRVTDAHNGGQMNYNNAIMVDEGFSGNRVYTGTNSRELRYSYDGGGTWSGSYANSLFGWIHEDQHFILDDVDNRGWLYVANDGGLYRSKDSGQSFEYLGNSSLSIAQVYKLTVNGAGDHLFDGNRYYIGTQDNGFHRGPHVNKQWLRLTCCDGMDVAVKDGLPYVVMVGLGDNAINRIQYPPDDDPCQDWLGFANGLTSGAPWGSDLVYNGADFYFNFDKRVWMARDGNLPWAEQQNFGVTVDHVNASPEDVVITGIASEYPVWQRFGRVGKFKKPSNPQEFWENKRVTDIEFGVLEIFRHVYISLSGTNGIRVVMSNSGGTSFTDITGDLPDGINARSVLPDPTDKKVVYIGSDLGVFVTTNGGLNWINFSDGLPAACYVNDLDYDPYDSKIVASTYGRGVFLATPVAAPVAFAAATYISTSASIVGNSTFLDVPTLNTNPDAIAFVTQNWNPPGSGGIYNNRPIGVWYEKGRQQWAIFNQDKGNMEEGVAFNLFVPGTASTVFVHKATKENINGNTTVIDNESVNDNPSAVFIVTQNWNPGDSGGTYNNHNTGVFYRSNIGRWAIFNQDGQVIPDGAAFNILAPDAEGDALMHVSSEFTIINNWTYIDHPYTNDNPNAQLFVTQNWNPQRQNGVYNDHAIGVYYDSNAKKWAIFNQDGVAMPVDAGFNVFIPGSTPTTSVTAADNSAQPQNFRLDQNYPNPFNPSTMIRYQLFESNDLDLSIFNLQGQLVQTLVQGKHAAGSYQTEWNGLDDRGQKVSSGVYLYRLKAGIETSAKRMLFMK
ncbi:T9SS type A sorting domain-containing protein [candidate division KSB1 bacterium]|nr:T9SS type A sorting domain-containing protein [candidate division KSB1 bacterium]